MASLHASQYTYPGTASHADHEVNLSRYAREAYGLLHLPFVMAPVWLKDDKKALAACVLRAD